MATSDSPLSVPNLTLAVARRGAPVTPPAGDLQYIFSDDFSSGDLLKTENGFTWGNGFRFTPSTENPLSGTHSMKIRYQADQSVDPENTNGTDSYLERRFNLGALYTTVRFAYDLYIPDGTEPWGGAAYFVRHQSSGGTNNKFFRLWGDDIAEPNLYLGNGEKIGMSTYPVYSNYPEVTGEAAVTPDFSVPNSAGIASNNPAMPLILAADLGTWVRIVVEVKMPSQTWPTNAESDGYMKVTKNGTVILDRPVNSAEDDPAYNNADNLYNHGYQNGYLLGWANTGFAAETILFIDNIEFNGVPK